MTTAAEFSLRTSSSPTLTSQQLNAIFLEADCPDSSAMQHCFSPQFGLLYDPPSHHCKYAGSKTGFTFVSSSELRISASNTSKSGVFGQLGRLLLLGITGADFKPQLILILIKSFHPSRAFLSSLACLLLTIKDEPRPSKQEFFNELFLLSSHVKYCLLAQQK